MHLPCSFGCCNQCRLLCFRLLNCDSSFRRKLFPIQNSNAAVSQGKKLECNFSYCALHQFALSLPRITSFYCKTSKKTERFYLCASLLSHPEVVEF